jgi:hypothetical protein
MMVGSGDGLGGGDDDGSGSDERSPTVDFGSVMKSERQGSLQHRWLNRRVMEGGWCNTHFLQE